MKLFNGMKIEYTNDGGYYSIDINGHCINEDWFNGNMFNGDWFNQFCFSFGNIKRKFFIFLFH